MTDYAKKARDARRKVFQMIHSAQSSHIGSNLSCTDILTVLFEKADLSKDIIMVKSWVAASMYYFLAQKGKIPLEDLDKFGQEPYTTILDHIPGLIPFATGAMGYNLPAAVGFALAKKLKGEEGKVYVLMSDGEMNVGTTWECALIAAHNKLDNLVVLVDRNGLQAMGPTKTTLDMGDLKNKWRLFNWCATSLDGHNYEQIAWALDKPNLHGPYIIICNTIKGKGISFMENENVWHYSHVNDAVLEAALKELQ